MRQTTQSKIDKLDAQIENAGEKIREVISQETDAPVNRGNAAKVAKILDNMTPNGVYDLVENLKPHDLHLILAEFDPGYFGRYYLPHHFPLPSCSMHEDMQDIMVKLEHREITKPVIYVAPRDHAKSTNFSLLFPIHGVCFRHFKHIGMFADASDQSQSHLANIAEELEGNEALINDFGPFRKTTKARWSAMQIETSTGCKIFARGMGGRIRGVKHKQQRPDLLILDDIENEKSVQSELQVTRLQNTVMQSVFNLGDAGNTARVIVGNFLPPDSVLARMYDYGEETGAYVVRHETAWVDDDWTKPLWPERWDKDLLMNKRIEVGHRAFLIEYMNVRNVAASLEFPENEFSYYLKEELPTEGMRYFMGVDVQSSQSARSDWFVISVVGLSQDGKIYDAFILRAKPTMAQKFDLIIDAFAKFNPEIVVIDTQGPQRHFYDSFVMHLRREKIPMNLYPLVGPSSQVDAIINALSTPFHDNVLLFNRAHKQLIDELVYLGTGTSDDCAAAFGMAVRAAVHFKAQKNARNRRSKARISGKSKKGKGLIPFAKETPRGV